MTYLDTLRRAQMGEPTLSPDFVKKTLGPSVNVIPISRPSAAAERTYLEQKIAANERQIGRLAEQIRWWKLELEGL